MKMFGKKSLSSVLYWVFILCFIGIIGLLIRELVLCISTNYLTIEHEGHPLVLLSLFGTLPKAVIFYLLIMIFKSFKSEPIFTAKTLLYLNLFVVFSLCMPILYALFNYFIFHTEIIYVINIVFPNLILGVFAAFIAAIFKKGIHLREVNDLTI